MRFKSGLVIRRLRRARSMGRFLLAEQAGATAIEYGLLLAGLSILILVAVFNLGDELEGVFWHVKNTFVSSLSS